MFLKSGVCVAMCCWFGVFGVYMGCLCVVGVVC